MKPIESFIVELRSQKVILDSDIAKIYGVETRDINKAVKNNLDKFPQGYIFEISKKELENLRWNISTAKISNLRCNISTAKISNLRTKNSSAKLSLSKTRVLPKAFTEKGLYMLATILKSKQATKATLQIIETFAKVREFSKVAKSLATEKNDTKKQNLVEKSGRLIGDILNQEFADDNSSETTIELNLAMIKIKHKINKSKRLVFKNNV